MWTEFFDLHSGGSAQTKYSSIFIELPKSEAIVYFTENFSDPYNVTCECCGQDYSVYEVDEADIVDSKSTLIIRESEIKK